MPEESRKKLFRGFPLWVVLTVPFFVQVVAVGGLIGYLSYRNGQKSVANAVGQLREEIGARIEEHLEKFLSVPHETNRTNAHAIKQGVLEVDNRAGLERHFLELIRVFESVSSIYFGNTEGGLVNAGREGAEGDLYVIDTEDGIRGDFRKYAIDGAGNRTDLLMTVADFDARARPWYIGAVEKDGPAWTDIYVLFAGNGIALAASRPVYDARGNLLGVVSCDLFLSQFCDFLKGIKIGKTGLSFAMERSGLLVATSTGESLLRSADDAEDGRRLCARESSTPTIRRAAEFLTEQVGDYRSIIDSQQFEFQLDGERQFLQISPVRDEYGIDWLVAVVVPESDFMAEINANSRTTVFLIVFALTIAIAGGIATMRWVSGPVRQLAASVQAFAIGDWKPVVTKGRVAEIGSLALVFNNMARKLAGSMEQLTAEVDQRKRTEETLRESEERYRAVVEDTPVLICRFLSDGKISYVNEAYCRCFGKTSEELIGQSFLSLIPEADRDAVWNGLSKMSVESPIHSQEHPVIVPDGEDRWQRWTDHALFDEQGEVVAYQSIGEDITDRKRAEGEAAQLEAQLRESRRLEAIGQLAGGVAHDFNNQLAGIINYSELLQRRELGKKERRYVDMVLKAAQRSADLTAQLLAFSRKVELTIEWVDIHALVGEVVSLLSHTIDRRITITQRLNADPSATMGDASQLESALLNLAVNASDAMSGSGELVIATDVITLDEDFCGSHPHGVTPGRFVVVSVSDTGVGMDEETLGHIFEPFFTTKGIGAGTGLGLAAVYGTVRSHAGTIDVQSELGQGSVFRIYLPLAPAVDDSMDEGTENARQVSVTAARLLLVDDEEVVRESACEMLHDLGYDVVSCVDGVAAVEYYRESWQDVDLVLLDMMMPKMNGHDAFRAMRAINSKVKVLLLSGFSLDHRIQAVLDEGALGYLRKPFRYDELGDNVAQVLDEKQRCQRKI